MKNETEVLSSSIMELESSSFLSVADTLFGEIRFGDLFLKFIDLLCRPTCYDFYASIYWDGFGISKDICTALS